MNKRLRKKLHRGEYASYGFHLEFNTKTPLEWHFDGKNSSGAGMEFSERLDECKAFWIASPSLAVMRWARDATNEGSPFPVAGTRTSACGSILVATHLS